MVEKQKLPRGLRNNNPGNIIKGNARWNGEIEGEDKHFCTFRRMRDGYIALIKVLQAYEQRHKLRTLKQIFNRYCPHSDKGDRPDLYAKYVCLRINMGLGQLGQPLVDVDTILPTFFGSKPPTAIATYMLWSMLEAITEQENGIAVTQEYRNKDGFPLIWDAYLAIWEFLLIKYDSYSADNSIRYVEKRLCELGIEKD